MKKWHKTIVVLIGAIVFSTIAIQASDIVRNIQTPLSGLALESQSPCGEGAVLVNFGKGNLCVDIYEASVSSQCPVQNVQNSVDTQDNINDFDCRAQSTPDALPWRYVSLPQAQQLCARSGKRLPTNDEWYSVALGVTDQSQCVTKATGPAETGSSECVTQLGVYDIVGNVWEWIDGQVKDGVYDNRSLPESGYVQLVDTDGVVVKTSASEVQEYGADYATINNTNIRGILRGGYYGSGTDAGIYAQNISVPLDFKAPGVGFRCVRNL